MSTRKPIVETLGEHKVAIIVAVALVAGGSIGGYFIYDALTARNPEVIILATTTSTENSGLLAYLIPYFTEQTGIEVRVVPKGTGTSIQYAMDGNADVIMVHARSLEDDFVNASLGKDGVPYGIHRTCIMYNDFIIVGPEADPADLFYTDNMVDVMQKLNQSMVKEGTIFISRGDTSGTHTKEKELWALIGIDEVDDEGHIIFPSYWNDTIYYETGSGMAATLQVAAEKQAYTLIDRGTWLSLNDSYEIAPYLMHILYNSTLDEDYLLNPYGVIPVNPVLYPHVKYVSVCRFIGFLTSDYGQDLIGNFKVNGEVLFIPAFGICNSTHNCPTTEQEVAIWTDFQAEFATLSI